MASASAGGSVSVVRGVSQEFTLERLARLHDMSHAGVMWRHDVDFDLDCAVQMARAEAERGIVSIFYLLPRSPDYNLFSDYGADIIEEIKDLGHRIGVHVDLGMPRYALVGDMTIGKIAEADYQLMRSFAERALSFHAPPADVLWRDVDGFDTATGLRWRGRYVGDSRGKFVMSPEELLADGKPAQIGLHGEWWFLPPDRAQALREQEATKP